MKKNNIRIVLLLLGALLLSGCALRTIDEMYSLPMRSVEYTDLQRAIDNAMAGLEYSAPLSGENSQTVQMADLDGDGSDEYLLFARGTSDDPMQILIFQRTEDRCELIETISCKGTAFELVEYADIDGTPGIELIVGNRVSEQVLKHLSVYTFADTEARLLMTANYHKFTPTDLNGDGRSELMVITPGEAEETNAVAALYSYESGSMTRSAEAALSASCENIKRIMISKLHDNISAVYIASSMEESAIITDVFALKNGRFTNVSFSNESGTSVKTFRNYYVYADDIDNDGVLELPDLITMAPLENTWRVAAQQLIRWYAMRLNGTEVDKMYTFHNFDGGWYLQLDDSWAPRVSVTQEGSRYIFYLWDEEFEEPRKLITIFALTGSDREEQAMADGRFPLYTTDGVVYAASLESAAESVGITQTQLANSFHPIHMDWKNGETE